MLVPRREQNDIDVADREQDDAPAIAERDDQLPEASMRLTPATGVRRKRKDTHPSSYRFLEPEKAGVIRRMDGQFAQDDVLLEAL